MALFLIAFNLNGDDDDRFARLPLVGDALRSLGEVRHIAAEMEPLWWLVTRRTAQEVEDGLRDALQAGDAYYILDITGQRARLWLPEDLREWLEAHRNG